MNEKATENKRIYKDMNSKKADREHPKSKYEARNAQEVLNGIQIVNELKDTDDTIGSMSVVCPECSAKKWKGETKSICCKDGKILLDKFPDPPPYLKTLWTANTPNARLFRDNSRSFNNALALASLKKVERRFTGSYNPSVIFEGKVTILCGPLMAEPHEQPRFAQLYIHDPSTQHTVRVKNMNLPSSLSKKQRESITQTMKKLQDLMMEINPYVKDFIHVCEIPEDEIKEGKLVISCKARPEAEHERRYNEQLNLSEVSVLTNSQPGDLVLRKRGGGLSSIKDLHPCAQPMHFTLLFPYGTKGYDESQKQVGGLRRVTPREFFSFHLNMRDYYSDFLFRG